MFRISKRLPRHRRVVNGSRLGAETRSSKSGISGDGRKSADSCSTKVLPSFLSPLFPREPTIFCFAVRLHHASHIPFTLASHLGVRRRDPLRLSRSRLGSASVAEGPQRTRQFGVGASVWEGCVERWEGSDIVHVGPHAWAEGSKFEAWLRYASDKKMPHQLTQGLLLFRG